MDYDYKKQLKESFKQFPEFSKKILLLICRMCTLPGVTVRSFFEVIEQCFDKQPYQIQGEIDALLLGGWIYVVGEDIKAIDEVNSSLEDNYDFTDDLMPTIINKLVHKCKVTPQDDLTKKAPYIRMGYSVLIYAFYQGNLVYGSSQTQLLGKLAVLVSKNIAVTGKLGNVSELYELPIYKILEFVHLHVEYGSTEFGELSLALANIHNEVFEYEGADRLVKDAQMVAIREGITDMEVHTLIAQSDIAQNKRLFGEAIYDAKMAIDVNEMLHGEGCNENIEVILRICDLCIIVNDKKTCRKWLEKVDGQISRQSALYIEKLMIEGAMYDDFELASNFFNEAELLSYRLYGVVLPEIFGKRFQYFDRIGRNDDSIKEYGSYMRAIRSLYGKTTNGDLAIYYASRVGNCLVNGAHQQAAFLNSLAIDLVPAGGPQFSYRARISQYLSIAATYCYATHNSLAETYSLAALEELNKHLLPTEMLGKVAEVFDEKIPGAVFSLDIARVAYHILIDIALEDCHLDKAEKYAQEFYQMVQGYEEESWASAYFGNIHAKMGRTDDALEEWEKALKNSGEFLAEIAAEICSYASEVGLLHFCLDTINDVLNKSGSCPCQCLMTFADIYESAGLMTQRDDMYRRALKAARSKDERCSVYFVIGQEMSDMDAIPYLRKSIDCEEDPSLCTDERLAHRWLALSKCQTAIGQYDEGRESANMAEKLYPAEKSYLYQEEDDE